MFVVLNKRQSNDLDFFLVSNWLDDGSFKFDEVDDVSLSILSFVPPCLWFLLMLRRGGGGGGGVAVLVTTMCDFNCLSSLFIIRELLLVMRPFLEGESLIKLFDGDDTGVGFLIDPVVPVLLLLSRLPSCNGDKFDLND